MDPKFQRDRFLIDERYFTIGDKYRLYDESGELLFYVEREIFKADADIHIYDDENKTRKLLKIKDKSLFDINATMEVMDPDTEELLGSFKRKARALLIRKTWQILDRQGSEIGLAQEDSLIKVLLHRLLIGRLGFLATLIKTDYIIKLNGRKIGKFNRKSTIRDKYVLDLSADYSGDFDKRLAVGLGIFLDSAEAR